MSTLFRGGTVFDGRRYLGRADVLVEGGRVVEVRPGGFETVASATSAVKKGRFI